MQHCRPIVHGVRKLMDAGVGVTNHEGVAELRIVVVDRARTVGVAFGKAQAALFEGLKSVDGADDVEDRTLGLPGSDVHAAVGTLCCRNDLGLAQCLHDLGNKCLGSVNGRGHLMHGATHGRIILRGKVHYGANGIFTGF